MKLSIPLIPPTRPGDNYQLNIKPEQIANAQLVRSRIELAQLCNQKLTPNPVICELGVYKGDFSRELIKVFSPSVFYLVDMNTEKIEPDIKVHPAAVVLQGLSWEMVANLQDESLDYVYIDADHAYHAVRNDIMITHYKLRIGGIIQFNDYTTYSPGENIRYGVLNAVNSYVENQNIKIIGLSIDRSGYHDIAVQKCS